jgi:hypothetical protein
VVWGLALGLQHFRESTWISRERKGLGSVAGGHGSHFRLHPEGAEEDWKRVGFSDRFEQLVTAVRMIAIDDYGIGPLVLDGFLHRLGLSDELWLLPLQLHHQAQQRGDQLFARKNQYLTQHSQPRKGRNHPATYGPSDCLA